MKVVGIGEALLVESSGERRPGGLAAESALAARALGHDAIIVSRIGQDAAGETLAAALAASDVDIAHLQTDPDLATGRLQVRSIAGQMTRHLDDHAAFDNLQWDFDLEDLAQTADLVVYGLLARRTGQTRSTIDRFLDASTRALRIFDMTNRSDGGAARTAVGTGMETAQIAIVDGPALDMLCPVADGDRLVRIVRDHRLLAAVHVADGAPLRIANADGAVGDDGSAARSPDSARAVVTLGTALLNGAALIDALAAMRSG